MDQFTFFTFISLVLITLLLIFGMKYFSAARQARLRHGSDDALRGMIEKLGAELAEMRQRLGAIETMLREVG